MSHDESHRFSAPASLPASGASAHSESYEGSLDMSIVPSPGLRERTNMPMPPPSPRGRDAKAKEDVGSHTSPASGRTSPASSTRHHASRSGSRTGAAGPSRARDAEQPLTEVVHSPVVRDGVSSQSLGLDFPALSQQLQESFARERRKLMKEREELARQRHKREMCELEVKSVQTLLEMEKKGRAMEVKWLQASIEKEKEERAKEVNFLKEERAKEVNFLKERRAMEVNHLKALLQEKDRRLQEKEERRESEVGLCEDLIAMLKERCEELKKEVQAASTGKPL
ncbi:hypothetical protein VTO73DRAFT_6905 [Trametes versicolor]